MITTNSNYSFYTKKTSRRFLIATISEQLGDSFNLGPSELNWEQTPFICGTDICRDFKEYYTLDMRRLKSLDENASHRFLDLSFVVASCPTSEARLNFLCSNFYLEDGRNNYEKGLYEELHSVEAEDSDFDYDEANGEYMDEEESRKLLGYIFVAYEGGQEDQFCDNDYDFDGFVRPQKFAVDWRKWSGIRELCETLPPQCTFKRMIFYREISETSSYKHVLLIEVNRILAHESIARNSVNNIRSQTNVYIDLSVSNFSRNCHYEVNLMYQPSPTKLKVPNQLDVNRNYTASLTRTPTMKISASKKLSVFSSKKISVVSNNNNGSCSASEKANSWNMVKNLFNRQTEEDEINNNRRGPTSDLQNRKKTVPKSPTRAGLNKLRSLFKNPFSRLAPNAKDSFNNNIQDKNGINNMEPDVNNYGTFGNEKSAIKNKFWTWKPKKSETPRILQKKSGKPGLVISNRMHLQCSPQFQC